MGGGRTPGTNSSGNIDAGTLCRGKSPAPGTICGSKNPIILRDNRDQKTREIFRDGLEFRSNYIDYNIINVDYWNTPFAKTHKGYRDFWVNYNGGRRLKFSLNDIPVRYALPNSKRGRWARIAIKPRFYYKHCGFIYPDHFGEGSTPILIDIVTTIEYNHRQREKRLEITTLTTKFSLILAGYAGAFSSGGIPKTPRGRVRLPTAHAKSPSLNRLLKTQANLQKSNVTRSAQVLTKPARFRHTITGDLPPGMSYHIIKNQGKLRISTGIKAHYGEGLYAWGRNAERIGKYIEIEVSAGTAVEKLVVSGQGTWYRLVSASGKSVSIRVVGTNLTRAELEYGARLAGVAR